MTISRRSFIQRGLAGAAALTAARPFGVLADGLGPSPLFDTARASRLFSGTWLAHADLHNHSLHSDGDGDPTLAFSSMRDTGLDVAALTDHSTVLWGAPVNLCEGSKDCQSVGGITDEFWAETQQLADAALEDGTFVAIRGFEWSSPTIGHVNVWGSQRWIDPLHTGGGGTGEGAAQFAHDEGDFPADQMALLDGLVRLSPAQGAGMEAFYRWLAADPTTPGIGGGADGVVGFNHPGREPGRFSNFSRLGVVPQVARRISSIEVMNRREDYIFEGTESIAQSPINECLNAGWRVGLTGVTDEHGIDWGHPDGKGRTGLWVSELSRAGVRDAQLNRRFFATNQRGLRLDASANGTRMGGALTHTSGPITFALDVDRGASWTGKTLNVQILRSGSKMPAVQANVEIVVPSADDPVVTFTADVDIADGDWIVLRVSDPSAPADGRADALWQTFGKAVAYASPFFLDRT